MSENKNIRLTFASIKALLSRLWARICSLFHRRYLRKMVLATIVFVMIPCCVAFWSFLHYSMEELNQSNKEYYAQSAKVFSDAFVEKLTIIDRHAAQISDDSRNSKRAAFQMQREALLDSPVNYYTIFTKLLEQYDYSICEEWGVYYQGYDILFSGRYKYTLNEFLSIKQYEEGPGFTSAMTAFFQNESRGLQLCPNYSGTLNGNIYVGYTGTMGLARDKVIFFYRLDAKSIGLDSVLAQQDVGAQFVLFEKETDRILFMSGNNHLYPFDLLQMYTTGRSTTMIDGIEYTLFLNEDESARWVSAVLFPSAGAHASEIQFFNNMQILLVGITLLLVLMLIALVHINYRPVQQTLTSLGLDTHDEFGSLQASYTQMQDELLERNQRILDLMLRNLLYNVPITAANAAKLGLLAQGNSYLVSVMVGTLDSQQRSTLMQALYTEMNIIASITDILALNYTVIICRSKQMIDHDLMEIWLSDYFQKNLPKCQAPNIGITVDSLNLIHESYASCFVSEVSDNEPDDELAVMPDPEDKKYGPRLNALKEQIESYLQDNLADCTLSQTSVADHFGVSVYSLSRLFKNQIGVGFSDYVNTLRLEAAHDLLLQSDRTITEISESVGFSNISYFARLFKQMYGMTPNRFRKENVALVATESQ